MFTKILPLITLMFVGVLTTSCDQNEMEEVATEKLTTVEKATAANIFAEEAFEGGSPLSTFHGVEFGTSHAFSVVTNPVFDGKKVGRIELRDTDPLESGGTRAEMVPIKDKMQKEMWFSFAVYFPAADFVYDSKKEIISQWHQSGGTSPPSYLEIEKDKLAFEVANKTGGHVRYELGAVVKNAWQQFTFHYIQSNGSDGLVEMWQNGKKVLTHKGGNIYALANLPKWKLGIYKWKWNGSETSDTKKRVLYYDNIRVGTAKATLADMTAGGNTATTTMPVTTPTGPMPIDPIDPSSTTPLPTNAITTNPVMTMPAAPGTTFTFVNAQTDRDYATLTNGTSLSLSAMGSPKVSIRANFGQAQAGSARFVVTGAKSYNFIDNAKPYALFGDDGKGNYFYGSYLPVGSYTMTVTPYSLANGKGTAGAPVTVKFTIVK